MKTMQANFYLHVLLSFVVFLSLPLLARAEELPVVPESIPEVITIDSAQVLTMVESGKALIIDARKAGDFMVGSVPGAFNCIVSSGTPSIDASEIEKTVTDIKGCADVMEADRSRLLVTFCNGLNCWRSAKAALAFKKLGFTKVHWYRLGMNDWKAKGFPME